MRFQHTVMQAQVASWRREGLTAPREQKIARGSRARKAKLTVAAPERLFQKCFPIFAHVVMYSFWVTHGHLTIWGRTNRTLECGFGHTVEHWYVKNY